MAATTYAFETRAALASRRPVGHRAPVGLPCTPCRQTSLRARSGTSANAHSVQFGRVSSVNGSGHLGRSAARAGLQTRSMRPVMSAAASNLTKMAREVTKVVKTDGVSVKVQLGLDGLGTVHWWADPSVLTTTGLFLLVVQQVCFMACRRACFS